MKSSCKVVLITALACGFAAADDKKDDGPAKPQTVEETFEAMKKACLEGDGEALWNLGSRSLHEFLAKDFKRYQEWVVAEGSVEDCAEPLGLTVEEFKQLKPMEGAKTLYLSATQRMAKEKDYRKTIERARIDSKSEKDGKVILKLDPRFGEMTELEFLKEDGEWKLTVPEGMGDEGKEEDGGEERDDERGESK